MSDPTQLAERYLAAWNEQDPARRRGLLQELWDQGATYVDPIMQGTGTDEIDALIRGVQERFPGFRFVLEGQVQNHAAYMRFSWGLGPEGRDSVIKGTDFARVQDDRFQTVVGFLDQVPDAA